MWCHFLGTLTSHLQDGISYSTVSRHCTGPLGCLDGRLPPTGPPTPLPAANWVFPRDPPFEYQPRPYQLSTHHLADPAYMLAWPLTGMACLHPKASPVFFKLHQQLSELIPVTSYSLPVFCHLLRQPFHCHSRAPFACILFLMSWQVINLAATVVLTW